MAAIPSNTKMKMHNAESMTDEQLAGQRMMAGFEGKAINDDLRFLIGKMHVGGIILFKRNISDQAQVSTLCMEAQACAAESGHPPLLISIDQEGGPVARLGPPFTVFPGNRAIGESGSEAAAREFGEKTAREMKGVGITMNFAPVLDVAPDSVNSVMSDRVFGADPGLVARLGNVVIKALQGNGIPATAKHFPGIGRTTLDSHLDLPYVDTGRAILESTDLIPFRAAITAGVEAVMLAHVVYRDMDPVWPASLSSIIARDLLRDTMGFGGVVFTDDLDMGAVEKHFDIETMVSRILDAKIDIALVCHSRSKIEKTYHCLLDTIKTREDVRQEAVASARRILALKQGCLPRLKKPSPGPRPRVR